MTSMSALPWLLSSPSWSSRLDLTGLRKSTRSLMKRKLPKAIRQSEIDSCLQTIADEEAGQADTAAYAEIIAAKKEAVGLQLEGVYRARLQDAYTQVKKRLDYQLETAN